MSLHIAQVSFFKPVVDGLLGAGVKINRLIANSCLDKFNLNDPENYVPVQSMYALFDEIKRQEGMHDLLETFAEQIRLVNLMQWGEMIAYAPTVLAACQLAAKYDRVLMTHECAGFEINGTRSKYWQRFTDKDSSGREQADFISFALALNGFRLAAGNDWAPIEIHLQSNVEPNLDVLLPTGNNTRVLLGQQATAVIFPTEMLNMPMGGKEVNEVKTPDFTPLTPSSLASKIDLLLDSMPMSSELKMVHFNELTDCSSRTLQRRLAREGTSVSEIADQWRFRKAIKLLANPQIRIREISEQLGYSNVPNFERAFRRWTRVTPTIYRENF